MSGKVRVFLDTSALFAGIWSAEGGGREILRLGEIGAIEVVLSTEVLIEIEAVMRRKAPDQLWRLAALLHRVAISISPRPPEKVVAQSTTLTGHHGDGEVLAAVWTAGVDFFATLDREHFLDRSVVRDALPFPLGTPGDFLAWYRARFQAP